MGATTFSATIDGKGMLPNDAYAALVEQARHDHGHDPYNGSISTTSGYVMVHPGRRPIAKVINEILSDETSHICKWGPAGCVELKGKALSDWRKRHGLSGTRARAYTFFGVAAE